MRYGFAVALVGMLVVAFGLSAAEKDADKPVVKDDQPAIKKDAPAKDAKPDQKDAKPDQKDAKPDQPVKKPAADAPAKKPLTVEDKLKAKKDGEPQAGGKLEAATVAGNVLTLTIDGKEYAIPISETKAMVKAAEQDGKQVVFAVQLVNVGAGGGKGQVQKVKPGAEKPDAPKKPGLEKPDAPKKPVEKAPVKTPDKKPE